MKVAGKTLWPAGTLSLREPRLANSGNDQRAARLAAAPPALKTPKIKGQKLVSLASVIKIPKAPRIAT